MILTKIDDGLIAFDRLYEKVKKAEDKKTKVKHEGELKKEIKRLQRHRDQVKAWINSTEVKDKSKAMAVVMEAQKNQERDIPGYITLDEKKLSSTSSRFGIRRIISRTLPSSEVH